jgi:hypothetical protein
MTTTFPTGLGRISLGYGVAGLPHQVRVYCKDPELVGAAFLIKDRDDVTASLDWEDAVTGLSDAVSYYMDSTLSAWSFTKLEQWDGDEWQLLAFGGTQTLLHENGNAVAALNATLSLRDTANKLAKVVISEINDAGAGLFHNENYSALASNNLALVKEFTESNSISFAPFLWMTSHRGLYLRPSAAYIALTHTFNTRIRRARGLV